MSAPYVYIATMEENFYVDANEHYICLCPLCDTVIYGDYSIIIDYNYTDYQIFRCVNKHCGAIMAISFNNRIYLTYDEFIRDKPQSLEYLESLRVNDDMEYSYHELVFVKVKCLKIRKISDYSLYRFKPILIETDSFIKNKLPKDLTRLIDTYLNASSANANEIACGIKLDDIKDKLDDIKKSYNLTDRNINHDDLCFYNYDEFWVLAFSCNIYNLNDHIDPYPIDICDNNVYLQCEDYGQRFRIEIEKQ